MHSDEQSVESAHCERSRTLNARLCAKRPDRKWITQWLWIERAVVVCFFFKGSLFLPLSGHFPKTWWRAPRRPSAGSMWPGRSMPRPPGRTGAASSRSWTRMRSPVNVVIFRHFAEETAAPSGHIVDCSARPLPPPSPELAGELRWPVNPHLDTLSCFFCVAISSHHGNTTINKSFNLLSSSWIRKMAEQDGSELRAWLLICDLSKKVSIRTVLWAWKPNKLYDTATTLLLMCSVAVEQDRDDKWSQMLHSGPLN